MRRARTVLPGGRRGAGASPARRPWRSAGPAAPAAWPPAAARSPRRAGPPPVRGPRARPRRPPSRSGRTPPRHLRRARDGRGAGASPAPARRSAAAGRSRRGSRVGEPARACRRRTRGPARGGSCSPPARPRAARRAARTTTAGAIMSPSATTSSSCCTLPDRMRTSRRSFKLKWRPRSAASASAVFVSGGRWAARRWISVRTAEGASRSALRVRVQVSEICCSIPASRYARPISSTMNGTPSA